MTLRYIYTYRHGGVTMDEDEYLRTIRHFLRLLGRVAKTNGFADDPAVARAKAAEGQDLRAHQQALFALIDLAKSRGLNERYDVNEAKELIRCRVLGCGLAGACNGVGIDLYPCPLKADR